MLKLEEIIDAAEGREIKRAIAVKMLLLGFKTKDICDLLEVSDAFVSKWKIIYENEGAGGLRLHYKGGPKFLTDAQRREICFHLRDKPHYSVEELRDLIERRDDIVYQSRQSYYDILKEAGLSWHRTQATNPKKEKDLVLLKQEEIKKSGGSEAEIVECQVVVYAQDECHLLWGDTTGYVWGRRNEKTGVPIQNTKQRQTYYGALNLYHRDFVLMPRDGGNSKNTVAFIKHLQKLNPDKKLILIWDGASYHRSEEVRAYLNKVNEDLEEKNWKITCLLFAPNAPEQNPVEDVWLRGKNFLRKRFYKNKTFRQVKRCFSDFINQQTFDFNKIDWYSNIPQSV